MQLTLLELFADSTQPSSSGKTSQESSTPKTTPSGAFLAHFPARAANYNRQGENGRTLVACLAPKEQSRGASLMPNTSEWPNVAAVCSLSQVLEKGLIPPRFFLSSTACAGILHRAEKRGKEMPEALRVALRSVVEKAGGTAELGDDVQNCLRASTGGGDKPHVLTRPHGQGGPDVAYAFAENTRAEVRLVGGDGQRTGALCAGGGKAGQGVPCIAVRSDLSGAQVVAFHPTQDPISRADGTTHALGCGSTGGQASVAVAIQDVCATDKAQNGRGGGDEGAAYSTKLHNTGSNNAGKIFEERTTCLDANSPPPALLTSMQVRRLTPVECERLQGFPDGYTAIPWGKKPASKCPDGKRYKALGNSWAVPVVRWIGSRILKELSNA